MRIARVEVLRHPMALRAPYLIATELVESAENVFVQIVTDGQHVGLGCGAPDPTVTGETVDACEAALRAASPALVGMDPLWRMRCLEEVEPILRGCPAAIAALDMALFDMLGKVAGEPVFKLIGGYRTHIATSITLFIDAVDVLVDEARRRVDEGFVALKIKGGLDGDRDIATVRAVRAAVGPDIALRFDANQGYTSVEAIRVLDALEAADLELFEQPTPRGQSWAMRRVTRATGVRVMADESVQDLGEALHLVRGDVVDMVNLKLMKLGGLEQALMVNTVARAAGCEAMVGCGDESALAISAGLHLALGRKNVAYADLDGHLDLLDDPAEGAVRLERGHVYPADAPGLGLARLSCFE